MSRRSPRLLALALDGLNSTLEPATTLARAQRGWESAVGETIALAGRPTGERDRVLTVTCADAVWSAELELMGPELVKRLNEEIGETLIDKLRCRTG